MADDYTHTYDLFYCIIYILYMDYMYVLLTTTKRADEYEIICQIKERRLDS